MAQHYPEIIGIILLLVFTATMFYHGTMIIRQDHGYSQNNYRRDSEEMRRRIEELLKDDRD